jgi:DNA-binding MarR family transcriptional regulator
VSPLGVEDDRFPRALTERTGFLLSMLGQASRNTTERVLAPLGIKPHHYGVLMVLDAMGPAPQHSVGERLGIDKSSMTVVVDHLAGLGMLERRRNPGNRRAYELTLTETGRETLARAAPLIESVEEVVLARLTGEERRQLHGLLVRTLPGVDVPGGS